MLEFLTDPTVMMILGVLLLGTLVAVLRNRKRDKCLHSFEQFPVTLAEQGGNLTWGTLAVYPTGLDVTFNAPVETTEGYTQASYLLYKDQYPAIDALYRYPDQLAEVQQTQRERIIERTANPSFFRRLMRHLRNWMNTLRDALLQAVSMVIGVAKTSKPGAIVHSAHEQQMKSLSTEIIGYAGNAYDPLLEKHLFRRVVVEIAHPEKSESYAGWLKDYSSEFIELVNVELFEKEPFALTAFGLDGDLPNGLEFAIENHVLLIENKADRWYYVHRVSLPDWARDLGAVLPCGYRVSLRLPPDLSSAGLDVWISTVGSFDMIVPRAHALIRHAVDLPETSTFRLPRLTA